MSDAIIGAIIGATASILLTVIARVFEHRLTASQANQKDSQTLLNLQKVADNAVEEQQKLQRKIDELQAAKQADYEFVAIFTLGPPPSIKKATLRAIPPESQ